MKKSGNWQIILGAGLIALSAAIYFIHYAIFRDTHHIFIYLIGDIAFVPVDVLLVTVIIHRLLEHREKTSRLKKMNMGIGTFFSEVGSELLKSFSVFDPQSGEIKRELGVQENWYGKHFLSLNKRIRNLDYAIKPQRNDLELMRKFLAGKRDFMIILLQNPNLLEHETFTDLLWAVFHLADELVHRTDLSRIPDSDLEHLAGDVRRVYVLLVSEWLLYMRHLRDHYPYLFSLEIRTNPFDPDAAPEVTK